MIKKIFASSLFILFISCTPVQQLSFQRTGMVSCDYHDKMTIDLVSKSQAENIGKAIGFAERNAIENLLFKGIPNSNQESPLIDNETKAKEDNTGFFNSFIQGRGYEAFLMKSELQHSVTEKNIVFVTQKVTFDLTNLRKHLENAGVSRGFGLY